MTLPSKPRDIGVTTRTLTTTRAMESGISDDDEAPATPAAEPMLGPMLALSSPLSLAEASTGKRRLL